MRRERIVADVSQLPTVVYGSRNLVSWGTTGFMVASGANGFVHNKDLTTCDTEPFDFHAEYATASPGNVVPWTGLQINVGFDFEIGHWELCGDAACTIFPDGTDEDDGSCSVSKTASD